jgi:hypothetical protein
MEDEHDEIDQLEQFDQLDVNESSSDVLATLHPPNTSGWVNYRHIKLSSDGDGEDKDWKLRWVAVEVIAGFLLFVLIVHPCRLIM